MVNGFKTVGPVQTQRDHRGRVGWHPEAHGEALRANVVRMFLEEFDHAFAKFQHSAPPWCWPRRKERTRFSLQENRGPRCSEAVPPVSEVSNDKRCDVSRPTFSRRRPARTPEGPTAGARIRVRGFVHIFTVIHTRTSARSDTGSRAPSVKPTVRPSIAAPGGGSRPFHEGAGTAQRVHAHPPPPREATQEPVGDHSRPERAHERRSRSRAVRA